LIATAIINSTSVKAVNRERFMVGRSAEKAH
jgi:hypothetical protein